MPSSGIQVYMQKEHSLKKKTKNKKTHKPLIPALGRQRQEDF
jgi:hypothetical protein